MSTVLRQWDDESTTARPRTITVESGPNSLLEFRSEQDLTEAVREPESAPVPLVKSTSIFPKPVPPPARTETPAVELRSTATDGPLVKATPRPFKMEPYRAPVSVLPMAIFALLIAASAAIIVYWWHEASVRAAGAAIKAESAVAPTSLGGSPAAVATAQSAAAPLARTGALEITSDPPGATVIVDGTSRGAAPVTLADVTPGDHEVSIVAGATTINRTVSVSAGATATVVASVVPARAEAGWVSIEMPFETEILEKGRLLGTTASARVALPPGWHELELRNVGLGFRAPLSVQILPGQTARPTVSAPTGLLSVNALPWAEVVIDGENVGTTPLANLPVPLGRHIVVLKHPQLGERRQTVNVSGATPVRIGVSFEQ